MQNADDPKDKKSAKEYDVGYGKPPKTGQFKAGQSGNARGRPKRSKNIKTLVNEILGERVEITEAGKKKLVSKSEALVRKAFAQAMKGDARARNMLVDLHSPEDPEAQREDDFSSIELQDVQDFAERMRALKRNASIASTEPGADADPSWTQVDDDAGERDETDDDLE